MDISVPHTREGRDYAENDHSTKLLRRHTPFEITPLKRHNIKIRFKMVKDIFLAWRGWVGWSEGYDRLWGSLAIFCFMAHTLHRI